MLLVYKVFSCRKNIHSPIVKSIQAETEAEVETEAEAEEETETEAEAEEETETEAEELKKFIASRRSAIKTSSKPKCQPSFIFCA